MRITSEMILEWNGDSTSEDLAAYLSAILNGEISLEVARNEIADYFDEVVVTEQPRNFSSQAISP